MFCIQFMYLEHIMSDSLTGVADIGDLGCDSPGE